MPEYVRSIDDDGTVKVERASDAMLDKLGKVVKERDAALTALRVANAELAVLRAERSSGRR